MHSTIPGADGQPDSAGPDPWSPPPPDERNGRSRVVGGVCALIAERLDLNPFFVRMAFVGLALAGGLGIVVYVGLWLILLAGDADARNPLRILGAATLLIGTVYLLGRHRTGFVTGTQAVVALLIGLGLALWQPRLTTASRADVDAPAVVPAATPAATTAGVQTMRQRAPRRQRSMLGQATLGFAVVTAAVGALIDQANGGRLHPEQWLGAAAAVCGAGMLVGTVWGRGRWLILPAVVLAGTGYIGGAAAERGISLRDRGTRYIDISTAPGIVDEHTSLAWGRVELGIYGLPPTSRNESIGALVGDVDITVGSDVVPSIDLHWDVSHGSVTINGGGRPTRGSTHIGPDRPPDVVIDVSIWRGDLSFWQQQASIAVGSSDGSIDPVDPAIPATIATELTVPPISVASGVGMTSDGSFVLGDAEATIDADDHLVLGESSIRADGVTEITTSYGTFQLLPRGLLLTPTGEVVDLLARRAQLATPTTLVAGPSTTAAPSTTALSITVPSTTAPSTTGTSGAVTTIVPTTTTTGS